MSVTDGQAAVHHGTQITNLTLKIWRQKGPDDRGHFRSEYQTDENEALRDDENFAYVSAWEWTGDPLAPIENKEPLNYEVIELATRSYK